MKERAKLEEKAKRKFNKDIDNNLGKILVTSQNQVNHFTNKLKKKQKEEAEEIHRQEETGVVKKAKIIGKYKYSQRKQDF